MSRNEHQPVQTGPIGCTAYLLQFAQCFYLVNKIHDLVVMIKKLYLLKLCGGGLGYLCKYYMLAMTHLRERNLMQLIGETQSMSEVHIAALLKLCIPILKCYGIKLSTMDCHDYYHYVDSIGNKHQI